MNNELKIEEILPNLTAPEPSESVKLQAINTAMIAYDKKIAAGSQGVADDKRLTDINSPVNNVRRFFMENEKVKGIFAFGKANKYIIAGLLGTTAIVSLFEIKVGSSYIRLNPIAAFSYMAALSMAGYALVKAFSSKKRLTAARFGLAGMFLAFPFVAHIFTYALSYEDDSPHTINASSVAFDASGFVGGGSAFSGRLSDVSDNIAASTATLPNLASFLGVEVAAEIVPTQMAMAPAQDSISSSARPRKIEASAVELKTKGDMAAKIAAPQAEGVSAEMQMSILPVDDVSQDYYKDEGRDKFKDFEENSVIQTSSEPVSTFSIDVDTASYSFMRRQLNAGVLPQKDAVRIEELVNYFDYSYALPEKDTHPFLPTVSVYDSPWKKGNKVIHVGIKGYDIETKPKSNLVFLIDSSGSMNSPDKLPLLVNSFRMLLDTLQPDDTVSIVVYAGSAGTVLEPTKVSEKRKILQALESMSAGGSTAGGEGIRQAYNLAEESFVKDGNNRIILATDGDFNVGITNPQELQDLVERKRDEGIYLSVLGFGQGNYNDHIMQSLAQNGNGNAAYIDNLNEARKVLVDEASSTLFTIAKDVKIQVEFNPSQVSEYRLIGYETRHLEKEDFNNDAVDAGEVGAGHTVTAIYEITPTGAPKLVDDLRYGEKADIAEVKKEAVATDKSGGDEYAFLKIRYKKPDSDTSILMTRSISKIDEVAFDNASDDVRFAAAVAGFGQVLKGSKFAGNFDYDKVIDIANAARGKDEFGYRTEFVSLVRLAKSAADMERQGR